MLHAQTYPTQATIEDQLHLEEEMRSTGIQRFRDQTIQAGENNQSTRTAPVRRLMTESHMKVVEAIEAFIETANTGKAGRRHVALGLFQAVDDVDLMAHLALRQVLDSITSRPSLSRAALSLAALIEDEMLFRAFKAQDKMTFKAVERKMKAKGNASYIRKSARAQAQHAGTTFEGWDNRAKLMLGTKLIELVIEATGIVALKATSVGANHTSYVVEATQQTRDWINTEGSRMEWLAPLYMPCLIPPKAWTTPFDGGYHSGKVRRLTLVKTHNRAYLSELEGADMPVVYGAVNALQETAWEINPGVLATMKEMWDSGVTFGILPEDKDDVDLPTKPLWLTEEMTKEEMTEEQQAQFRAWKQETAAAHDRKALAGCKRASFSRMMWVADKFAPAPFYFPYQLDFRGRIYPVPLYLHPQGNDAARGLLTFSKSVPIYDEDAELWLAVHGAGLWGVDKVSMADRRAWVLANDEAICLAGNNPMEGRFWTTAEKPWQALAFCIEWAGYRREGFGYESNLPVQMDGTCNGLQNFSAILRDEVGGAAVNLIPGDKPSDIYAKVAELVSKLVEQDAMSDDPEVAAIALGWLGKVNRKVCKRPVMTLAYGAREYGFKQQVFEDTVIPWKASGEAFPWVGSGWKAAEYMGKLIWTCTGQVVVAARAAMDWLQEASRAASKAGIPVNWRTPCGLMVSQAYRVTEGRDIRMTFDKVSIRLKLAEDKEKIDGRRQASGIAPNWVHSLDAAHLMRTTVASHESGIRSFSMIHDSYGTHAGNAQVLATSLREQFVAMYSERDVLKDFAEDVLAMLPEGTELPPMPAHGNLDLNLVLDSPFFFA